MLRQMADVPEQQWFRADGRALTPFELRIYERAGLTPAEAVSWADAGLEPYATEGYRKAGYTLEEARRVHELGLTSADAALATRQGLSLETLAVWRRYGSVAEVESAVSTGMSLERFARLATAAGETGWLGDVERLADLGCPQEQIDAWAESDVPLAACLVALVDGVAPADVEDYVRWSQGFPDPTVRKCWQMTGRTVEDATRLAESGLRPIDALEPSHRDQPARQDIEVIVDDRSPFVRRTDGEQLPGVILEHVDRPRPSVRLLRAFGFTVVFDDTERRFLAAWDHGLLLTVLSSAGRKRLFKIQQTGDGFQVREFRPRTTDVDHGSVSDFAAGVDVVNELIGQSEDQLVAIDFRGVDAADALAAVVPLAHHAHDETVRFGETGSAFPVPQPGGVATFLARPLDGGRLFVDEPIIPGPTPGGPDTIPGLLVDDWSSCTEVPVTLATAGDGSAHGAEGTPLITVRRTTPTGDVRLVSLHSEGDGVRLFIEGEHPKTSGGVVDAETAAALLGDANPGEMTEIWLGTDDDELTAQVAGLVRVTAPEDLGDDGEWPLDIGVKLETGGLDGAGCRPIFIQDRRWLPVPVRRRYDRPLLVGPIDEDAHPVEPTEHWVSVGFSETASMTSGYNRWSMGRTGDPDVLMHYESLDGEPPLLFCWYRPDPDKCTEIVHWLQSRSNSIDFRLGDTVMLAVETLAGDDRARTGEVPESIFDDDGSETADYDLTLDVYDDEIEKFLQAVATSGRGDAVEAVTDPDSAAGQRRHERLRAAGWTVLPPWQQSFEPSAEFDSPQYSIVLGLPELASGVPSTKLYLEVEQRDDARWEWRYGIGEAASGFGNPIFDSGECQSAAVAMSACERSAVRFLTDEGWTEDQIREA